MITSISLNPSIDRTLTVENFQAGALNRILGRSDVAAGKGINVALTVSSLGLDAECIRAGKLADLTVIDLHRPNMVPVHNIVKNLVYSGSDANVRMTMVNGKLLYEDGVFHVGDSPETIYRMAQEAADRLTKD